jgi:hypothetical protein
MYMTAGQARSVRGLLDKYSDATGRRLFGWGGDWLKKNPNGTYAYLDEMHVELAQSWAIGAKGRPTTPFDIDLVMSRLKIDPTGHQITTPKTPTISYKNLSIGKRNADVLTMQKALANYVSLDYSTAPGLWGPRTQAAWLKASAKAKRSGLTLAQYLGTLYHFGVTR